MTQTVVSLSTIPPRFAHIGATLRSLLNQSVRPDRIELWIPRTYRRFPTHPFTLPDVPDGVTIEVTDEDLGPATKILPCARKYRGTDTRIVYVDDDRHYWQDWLKSLLAPSIDRPGEAIAAVGHDLIGIVKTRTRLEWVRRTIGPDEKRPRVKRHRARRGGLRNLPRNIPYWVGREFKFRVLGKPPRYTIESSGYADIAEGYGGVLVRPDFYDDAAFAIPPVLWAVDDQWLSGCLARKKIPIWIDEKSQIPTGSHRYAPINNIAPLYRARLDGHNRGEAVTAAIEHFREHYGVWL